MAKKKKEEYIDVIDLPYEEQIKLVGKTLADRLKEIKDSGPVIYQWVTKVDKNSGIITIKRR